MSNELTEQAKVELLATKLMKWQKWSYPGDTKWCVCGDTFEVIDDNWNPFKNWNHTAMLEDKIMEDGKGQMCKKYLACFESKAHYMSSTKSERCDYILSLIKNE